MNAALVAPDRESAAGHRERDCCLLHAGHQGEVPAGRDPGLEFNGTGPRWGWWRRLDHTNSERLGVSKKSSHLVG